MTRPLAVYLASRLVVLAVFAVAAQLDEGGGLTTLDALGRWDGGWYARVAEEGYPPVVPEEGGQAVQSTLAFFPLFPAAIRVVMAVTGLGALPAAVVANVVFGVAFAVALWWLVRRLATAEVADRAVVLVSFFPASFVLSMAYAEPLMLALAAACLLFLVDRRWVAAGVAAAIATATRPNAVALVAACAWGAGDAVWRRQEWRALVAPALAPVGFLAFQAFLWNRTGEATAWFRVQEEAWHERTDFGAATFDRVELVLRTPFADQNVLYATLGFVLMLVLLVLLWRWRPPAVVSVYTVAIVALALGSATLGGRPRFVLTAFPLVVAAAVALRGTVFTATVAASASLLAAITIVTATTLQLTP